MFHICVDKLSLIVTAAPHETNHDTLFQGSAAQTTPESRILRLVWIRFYGG